uniref:Uncharacterized protein n=1 Tax=Arundo donax TaxID=35708 RepID=A0A0A9GZJ2_ARUDO
MMWLRIVKLVRYMNLYQLYRDSTAVAPKKMLSSSYQFQK